jgi:thioredoxin-dependent peroxiredoxin
VAQWLETMGKQLLAVGASMPDITLRDSAGEVRLRELIRPGGLVVYFYPHDDTPGCTVESCHFRDQYEDFVAAGADVVGISSDSPQSHEKFKAKHRLPFRLLTDADSSARAAFGVGSTLGLLPGRVTFVFDAAGQCRYSFDSQLRVHAHVERALQEIRKLPPATSAS